MGFGCGLWTCTKYVGLMLVSSMLLYGFRPIVRTGLGGGIKQEPMGYTDQTSGRN